MCRVLLVLVYSLQVAPATASDFWDEVRTPGLRAWRQDLTRARIALRARRFDQARVAATAAIERLPQRAEGYVVRALVAGELGAVETAHTDLVAALELDGESLDGADGSRGAEILARAGDYSRAAIVLRRVLGRMRQGRGRRNLYGLYGDMLMALGEDHLVDAIRAYREAIRAARHDPRSSLGLALALRRQSSSGLEWRDFARRVVARGRLEALLTSLPIPESERAARRAVAAEAMEDAAAARAAWAAVDGGPWASHAAEQLAGAER